MNPIKKTLNAVCSMIAASVFLLALCACTAGAPQDDPGQMASPHVKAASGVSTADLKQSPYQGVLESILRKIELYGGDPSHSDGVLKDVTGDGVEELVVCYELQEVSYVCEVWTQTDGVPIQLAAVGDFQSLAGFASMGISQIELDGVDCLCIWRCSTESGVPRQSEHYEFSLWPLVDRLPAYPDRFSASLSPDGQMECSKNAPAFCADAEILSKTYRSILDGALCRSWDGDGQIAQTLENLLSQLVG